MAKLTKDQIIELKEKGLITHVIPSEELADNTVDELKIDRFVTITTPSADIEEAVTHTIPVTGVSITGPDEPIAPGGKYYLTIDVEPEDATNQNVTVVSSDENIAEVGIVKGERYVEGIGTGTATITVTTEDGGFTDTCEVVVVME